MTHLPNYVISNANCSLLDVCIIFVSVLLGVYEIFTPTSGSVGYSKSIFNFDLLTFKSI